MSITKMDRMYQTVASVASSVEMAAIQFREVAMSQDQLELTHVDLERRVTTLINQHAAIIISVAQLSQKLTRLIAAAEPRSFDPVSALSELP